MIKNNSNACFEIDCDTKLVEGEKPCDYGYEFKSIIDAKSYTIITAHKMNRKYHV